MNLKDIEIPPSPNLVVPTLSIPPRDSLSAPSNEALTSNIESNSEAFHSTDYLVMQEALSNEAVGKYARTKDCDDAASLGIASTPRYTLAKMESLVPKTIVIDRAATSSAAEGSLLSTSRVGNAPTVGELKSMVEEMRSHSDTALSEMWKSGTSMTPPDANKVAEACLNRSKVTGIASEGITANAGLVSPEQAEPEENTPSSFTDSPRDVFKQAKPFGRNYTSSFVYSSVMNPVKTGTVFGFFRVWYLIVWVVKRYTTFFLQCLRFYLGIYHGFRILVDIYGLLGVHWIGRIGILRPVRWLGRQLFGGAKGRQITLLHRELARAQTYEEWYRISEQLDEVTGAKEWCQKDDSQSTSGHQDDYLFDSRALKSHLDAMQRARSTGNISEIIFLLRVCCNRHFCHLRNPSLYSVSFVHTKKLIEDFYHEVLTSLDYLNDHVIDEEDEESMYMGTQTDRKFGSPNGPTRSRSTLSVDHPSSSQFDNRDGLNTREFLKLLSALRLSMGRTALCLSGGGALAVYHMGILRALIENNMVPKVISGTSGGAISAGAMAIWNDEELLKHFLRPAFLEEHGLALCPPWRQQLRHLWSTGYLLDQKAYINFVRILYGEITFSEAFQRTGRFVSITTVPAGRSGPCEPLVCNCINTPDILIWSAVVASCSLPLVLPPTALFTKSRLISPGLRSLALRTAGVNSANRLAPNACATCVEQRAARARRHPTDRAASPPSTIQARSSNPGGDDCTRCGTLVRRKDSRLAMGREPESNKATRFVSDLSDAPIETNDVSRYAPDSMLFVDGSILQDIPHTELQTLFNVKSFVVSQVNPHFTPFVQGPSGYRNQKGAVRWALDQLWNYLALDLRNRYARLLALAIVPKIKGQDVSPFLMQSAEGHLTICPAPPSEFWKLTAQPSTDDMRRAMEIGHRKTWPYITRLRHVLIVENKLKQLWVENLRYFENRGSISKARQHSKSHLGSTGGNAPVEDKHLILSRYRVRPSGSVVSAEELLG